jgi:hypothetical protein
MSGNELGPSQLGRVSVGFAPDAPGSTSTGPVTGFAPYLNGQQSGWTAPTPQPYERRTESYDWPEIVVARPFDVHEAGSTWDEYAGKLEDRMRPQAAVIPLKNWRLVYYGADEISDLMTEAFPRIAKQAGDGPRRKKAREVVGALNGIIDELVIKEEDEELKRRMAETPNLRDRARHPDDNALILDDHQAEVARTEGIQQLWLPAVFAVDGDEGYGKFGFGLRLQPDLIVNDEMRFIGQRMRKHPDLHFNLGILHNGGWQMGVQTVDTSPLSAAGMKKRFPGAPIPMPFKKPRAFFVDKG